MICRQCGWDDKGTGSAHACGAYPQPKIEIVRDHVAEKLDEIADLCEYWTRNRAKGRNPTAVRAALLMLAKEVTAIDELTPSNYKWTA